LLYPAELLAHVSAFLERAMGIEPTYPAWKAGVLPLNYARMAVPIDIIDIQLKDNNNIFANCQYFCGKNF
jgi:hypothetical protein